MKSSGSSKEIYLVARPREPGYRVEDWTWEARRVRSTVRQG